jgi:hypothetical protein
MCFACLLRCENVAPSCCITLVLHRWVAVLAEHRGGRCGEAGQVEAPMGLVGRLAALAGAFNSGVKEWLLAHK